MMIQRQLLRLIIVATGLCTAALASAESAISISDIRDSIAFTTWQGIEPDKWATIWLIKRHLSPDAYFLLVPPNSELPALAYPFGVPDAALRRGARQSMFRRLKLASGLELHAVSYLDGIIQDIEVNIWDAPEQPHSIWVEALYRQLQARYHRDQVPVDCYLAFFDGIARLAKKTAATADDFSRALDLKEQCPGIASESRPGLASFIPPMDPLSILRAIGLGKNVVFVDTREDDEYTEVHLPGARVLRLRDVDDEAVRSLSNADRVVPYCVKDFRGYEVAKALKRRGSGQVATLSPNGLKGWVDAGLPVVRPDGLSTDEAMATLMRCAMEPARCLSDGNGL